MSDIVIPKTGFVLATLVDGADRAASSRAVSFYLASQLSLRSRQSALDSLRRLARLALQKTFAEADEFPWPSVNYEVVRLFRRGLFEQVDANAIVPATANLTISHLRGIIKTMLGMGIITRERFKSLELEDLKGIKATRKERGVSLSLEAERQLRSAARALSGYKGILLDSAIVMAIGGGLRREEVCDLAVSGLVQPGYMQVIGKGSKEREIGIDADMQPVLDGWLKLRPTLVSNHDRVFCSIHQTDRPISPWSFWLHVRGVAHDAFGDVDECKEGCRCFSVVTGPHDFRRTFATRLFAKGWSTRDIQILMGHESPETTARYDKREARTVIDKRREERLIA